MTETVEVGIGSKVFVWSVLGGEIVSVMFDLRYMVILSFVLILADLWWGHSESCKRRKEAEEMGNATLVDKYKWSKSRAVRRTLNKLIDYLTYLGVGALVGLGITEPMGICSHVWVAAIGLGLGGGCEVASIIGHAAYVKMGVEIKVADAWKAVVRFFARLIKTRSQDIGDAVEELVKGDEEK